MTRDDLALEHDRALAEIRAARGQPPAATMTTWVLPLSTNQQDAYAAIVRMGAGCRRGACEIKVIGLDDDGSDQIRAVVTHASGGENHWVKTGCFPRHVAIDPVVADAMHVVGVLLRGLKHGETDD